MTDSSPTVLAKDESLLVTEAKAGSYAAFDPVANLRVGAKVLQECIARAGSVELGLKHYVGAANTGEDGGYAAKVLAEQGRLKNLAVVARQSRS